jgi:hypothetical protein
MVNKIYYQVVSEKIKFLLLDMPKLWIKLSFRNWGAVIIISGTHTINQPFHLLYLLVQVKAMKRKDKLGFP